MENEKIVVLQFKLSRKHCLFALAFAFLCFHPRPLGSETLTLTTYYPAPYGGYVALLTTGGTAGSPVNTLLARDAGTVGIGTSAPDAAVKLDVNGLVKITGGGPDEGKVLTSDASGIAAWGNPPSVKCYWQDYLNGTSTQCTETGYTGAWLVMAARTTSDWTPDNTATVNVPDLLSPGGPLYMPVPSGTMLSISPGRMMPQSGQMLCCEIDTHL